MLLNFIFLPLQTINIMEYNGTEGRMISRSEAQRLLADYQNSPAFAANNHTEGILFGRDHLLAILAQPGCKGMRIYYGKEGVLSTDPSNLVIVGTNAEGNDMAEMILDAGLPCPDKCSSPATKL